MNLPQNIKTLEALFPTAALACGAAIGKALFTKNTYCILKGDTQTKQIEAIALTYPQGVVPKMGHMVDPFWFAKPDVQKDLHNYSRTCQPNGHPLSWGTPHANSILWQAPEHMGINNVVFCYDNRPQMIVLPISTPHGTGMSFG